MSNYNQQNGDEKRPGQFAQFPMPGGGNMQPFNNNNNPQPTYNFPDPMESIHPRPPNVPLMPVPGGFQSGQNFPSYPIPEPQVNNLHNSNNTAFPTSGSNQSQNNQNSGYVSNSPGNFFGPFLKYGDIDLQKNRYYATVLIVAKDIKTTNNPPTLFLEEPGLPTQNINPFKLDQFKEHGFWRYSISCQIENHQKKINYSLGRGGRTFTFYVQSIQDPWRWSFFSCNGFSNDVTPEKQRACGGANPLWNDLMSKHDTAPFHAMVGGGDQLYCDDVFLESAMKSWLDIPSRKQRDAVAFTEPVEFQVMEYYFKTYCEWFSQGTFAAALASIPYAMVTDDHDIFDGFGSYPERMMHSPYFQGIFKCAMRFFLLFQAHTTPQYAYHDGYFGERSYSWLKKFGPHTAVVGIDNRSERSIHQVSTPDSYNMLFDKLYNETPLSCKHLMVILGIPIVYPRLTEVEGTLNGLTTVQHRLNIHKLFHKTGAFSQLVNQFGQPELLDDLCDHWTAADHLVERLDFIRKLQGFARDRSIRVSFLAGDVHLGAAGYLGSPDPRATLLTDHRHMTQIVSSGIVNLPPPDMVVTMLHRNAQRYTLDNYTIEDMYPLFTRDVDGTDRKGATKCLNRRNWCGVYQDGRNHEVKFVLFVENKENTGSIPYEITVCPLQSIRQ